MMSDDDGGEVTWTATELAVLRKSIRENGLDDWQLGDWAEAASAVGGGKTPKQCFDRWIADFKQKGGRAASAEGGGPYPAHLFQSIAERPRRYYEPFSVERGSRASDGPRAPASEPFNAYRGLPYGGGAGGGGDGEVKTPFTSHPPHDGDSYRVDLEGPDRASHGRPHAREPDVQPNVPGWGPRGASAHGIGRDAMGRGGLGCTRRGWEGGGGGPARMGRGRGEHAHAHPTGNLSMLASYAAEEDGKGEGTR